jgi:hypothetical protein
MNAADSMKQQYMYDGSKMARTRTYTYTYASTNNGLAIVIGFHRECLLTLSA